MRIGRTLVEVAAIVGIALVIGTSVHVLRQHGTLGAEEKKKGIAFVADHPDPYRFKVCNRTASAPPASPAKPAPPAAPPAALPATPAAVPVVSPGAPQVPQAKTAADEKKAADPDIRDIDVDAAKAELELGTPFLDARRTRQFKQGHISGARSVSIWEAGLDERITALFTEIPFELPVIVYCSSGDCEDSHQLAGRLKNAGYKNIRVLKGGFPEWQKKNFPIEKSEGAGEAEAGAEAGGDTEEKDS